MKDFLEAMWELLMPVGVVAVLVVLTIGALGALVFVIRFAWELGGALL